ncbi:Uncharacterized protein TPAR_06158 [Tolypocladium paradoxum]|uniref:DUF1279 domain-containing protein n=1 Tax=Tolypocladium paradoxum TaxID=94208 RepID=A0A2S4KTX7_9HYPO|nr:Uncharacterized protein TPAR_06158 [Tolypocladium paradoxum]
MVTLAAEKARVIKISPGQVNASRQAQPENTSSRGREAGAWARCWILLHDRVGASRPEASLTPSPDDPDILRSLPDSDAGHRPTHRGCYKALLLDGKAYVLTTLGDPNKLARHATISPRSEGTLSPDASCPGDLNPCLGRRLAKVVQLRDETNLIAMHATAGLRRPTLGVSGTTFGRMQQRGFRFSAWRRSTDGAKPQEKLSFGARLKKLSKEYGWSAVGVYLALSVLDFPFCFLLVRIVGTDTIGKVEHYVVSTVSSMVPESVRQTTRKYWHSIQKGETQKLGDDGISEKVEMAGWGVQEAQERNKEEASLATQLALAYAIHKSFIFIRVPLTAAVTPKVVKVLRGWGWNIGKRSPR